MGLSVVTQTPRPSLPRDLCACNSHCSDQSSHRIHGSSSSCLPKFSPYLRFSLCLRGFLPVENDIYVPSVSPFTLLFNFLHVSQSKTLVFVVFFIVFFAVHQKAMSTMKLKTLFIAVLPGPRPPGIEEVFCTYC